MSDERYCHAPHPTTDLRCVLLRGHPGPHDGVWSIWDNGPYRAQPIEPVEARFFAVQPGDRILLSLDRNISYDGAQRIEAELAERFPGVQFTIISGGLRIEAVHREP